MDPITFENSFSGKNLTSQCLVCGTLTLGNYVDLSLGSSRTSHSDTLIQNKLHTILLNSWVIPDIEELIICISCFHLVDQFDVLEAQLDAIRKDLTDKYMNRKGIRSKTSSKQQSTAAPVKRLDNELKRKRRQYTKRKKHTYEESNECRPITPDNSILNLQLEQQSLNINSNITEIHSMSTELPWSQESVQLQQLGDIAVSNNCWKKSEDTQKASVIQKHGPSQIECPSNTPAVIYIDDPNFLNSGERLRVGADLSDHGGMSFACVYCNQIALSIEVLKSHFHLHHCPKVLTAPIPIELGLGSVMNCGIQLENVNNAANDSVKPFACIFCDGSFKFKSNLNLHFKEKHTPNKPFTCVECLESFRRSMELSRHKVYYCPHRKKNLHRKDKKAK